MLNSIANGISGSLGSYVMELLYRMPAILVALAFHEWAHAYAAYKLGDPTAYNLGRMTLNPLAHIDLIGLIMMMLVRFGWAKPVPIDMRNFKHPVRDMAITAAAGPISNVILAFFALCVRAGAVYVYQKTGGMISDFIITFTEYTAILSIGLAVFNVIPIPPLDGSKVVNALLPQNVYYKILRYERYGFLIMMLVLWTGILDVPLDFCRSALLGGLGKISVFPYYILKAIFG